MQNGATSTDNVVVKTIYDPCPVGYTVAPVNAFAKMTTANWDSTNNGSLQQGCWFPGVGYRTNTAGVLNGVGTYAAYWQAVPATKEYARYLRLTTTTAVPAANNRDRSYGNCIRPVTEKD